MFKRLMSVLISFQSNRYIGQRYAEFQVQNGLQVSVAQLRWYTTCLNRCFLRMGQCKPRIIRAWFTLGAWFGVLLMFVGAVLLTLTLMKSVSRTEGEQPVLTPVVRWDVSCFVCCLVMFQGKQNFPQLFISFWYKKAKFPSKFHQNFPE